LIPPPPSSTLFPYTTLFRSQRGLAQAGRPEQQHVVQRLAALACRADEDLQLLARLGLANVLAQQLGAQRALDRLLVGRSRRGRQDRKSTRLNSSHVAISYAV